MLVAFAIAVPAWAGADSSAPAAPAGSAAVPDLATRVADLEAYVTNGAPKALISRPAPGTTRWMMTSTALVLFMTLPGLALFYGGLVRRKNVLSVLAQCFGCAGLVTILWWAIGYSLAFAPGTPILGGTEVRHALSGVTSRAQRRLRRLGLAERVLDVPADVRDHHARRSSSARSPSA